MRKLESLLPWQDEAPRPLKATAIDVAAWFIKFQRFESERYVPAADIAESDPTVSLDVFLQHYQAFVKWRERLVPETAPIETLAFVPWTKPRSISLEASVTPSLMPPDCPIDYRRLWRELPEKNRPILMLSSKGYRSAEIAAALGIKVHRVDAALRRARKLCGARDRFQLALAWRGITHDDEANYLEWDIKRERLRKWNKENAVPVEQYYVEQRKLAVVLTVEQLCDLIIPDRDRTNNKTAKQKANVEAWRNRHQKKTPVQEATGAGDHRAVRGPC